MSRLHLQDCFDYAQYDANPKNADARSEVASDIPPFVPGEPWYYSYLRAGDAKTMKEIKELLKKNGVQ
jgi:hypothetical protein